MKRDVALAIFDGLIVRGFNPTLSAFHGVVEERSGHRRQPIYNVQVGGLAEPCIIDETDMRVFLELAEAHDLNVFVEPNGFVRIAEKVRSA